MYAAGDQAQLLERDSAGAWRRMIVPAEINVNLQSLAAAPEAGLMAVGTTGVVLYRR